jgi:hypothetical protein
VKYLWNTATLLIVIVFTVAVSWVSYARGYHNGNYDERVLQTEMLIDLTNLVAERCR